MGTKTFFFKEHTTALDKYSSQNDFYCLLKHTIIIYIVTNLKFNYMVARPTLHKVMTKHQNAGNLPILVIFDVAGLGRFVRFRL